MLVRSVAAILDRDLRTLRREVEAYADDRQLWQEVPGIPNTAGTLVLHLTGNIQHYIGAKLGGSGYARDRPAEFSRRDLPRAQLLLEVEAARTAVARAFAGMSDRDLPPVYPEPVGEARVETEEYLVHLTVHFAYHLGQLDTIRRIVTGDPSGVDAVRAAELGSARPAAD
jgi:uncharacterized damage-inducible protein DinB